MLLSTHEGIAEVAISLCPDTGRNVISTTEAGTTQVPKDQIREIRIAGTGAEAQVSVVSESPDCPSARRTTTDPMGRFAFTGIPPGPYRVYAQLSGYIGQVLRGTSPDVVSKTVNVKAQEVVGDLFFYLIKGGTVTGTVRDMGGRPLTSVTVQALPAKSRTGIPAASAPTDDRGQYRVFGLPPGDFIVRVPCSGPMDRLICTETYFPNVAAPLAQTITLREGEEVTGIDVMLLPLHPVGRN